MQIIDNTDEPSAFEEPAFELKANVTGYGREPKAAQGITPEDQHYVDQVLAMDMVNDVPGASVFPAGRTLSPATVEALSPEMRKDVLAQLQGLDPATRAAKEPELVAAAIRKALPAIRIATGLGSDALPYHREMVSIARDVRDLDREFQRVTQELAEVRSYGVEIDPETGKSRPKEILAVQGQRRRALENRQEDLLRNIRVLEGENGSNGIEAQRRLAEAMAETIAILKERDRQVTEDKEAKSRAVELAREERINRKAQSYARMNGGNA